MGNIQEEIEDKVIDCIALQSGGRLVAFKPQNSDKDLAVEKRSDYKNKIIFFKIYNQNFSEADLASIDAEEDFYLLFVHFDIVSQELDDDFYIVPSSNIEQKFLVKKKDFAGYLIEKFKKK